MKNKKVFIFFLLSILLVSNNNIAHSQTYNHNNWTYQNDNNSQQAFALIDAIKSNVFNNDFKSARKDFIELIKQVDASSLRAEDKLKYFNIVNEVTSRYFYSEKDISKRQRAVLEIKNIYKELFLYDSRFQDSYINSIQAFIAINNNSNTALYGVLDLIDIYLNSIQNKDDSKLDDLFKIYDTYNDNLITNSIFKASIHNRLKKTVDLFTHLAESDFPALNTRYLPYLSMSLSYLGNFYLINATTDDAKKLYDKAFDTAKILSPNSPNFYEQLDVLDMSLERLSWKYLESNSILKRNELNIKVWNYYYFLLKNNYLKVANLHNYTKFMQDASFYYYKNSQYDDYSNLYNFIRNLTDNITEEQLRANNISGFNENFGLYGLESIYKELVQQGKIQPYKTTDIASTPEHSLSNVEISTETAIKYEKESSQYADGRKATESLKKAAYVYSELNKSERGKYDEKLAAIYVVIARESSTLNDNDFLNYSQKAVQLIEKNKETTSDYNLQSLAYVYMRLGEYYMKKKNCSVAENYLNKSVDAARYTLKNRKVDSNLAHSLLMPYRFTCNFYEESRNFNKSAIYRAEIVEIIKKYIYYPKPDYTNTIFLSGFNYDYAKTLYYDKQYEKAKKVIFEDIKVVNDFVKNNDANTDTKIGSVKYEPIADIRLLADIYLFTYNFIKAEQTFTNYIKIKEKAVPNKDIYYYKDLLKIYKKLVFIYQSTGQKKKETQALNEIKLINQQIKKLQAR